MSPAYGNRHASLLLLMALLLPLAAEDRPYRDWKHAGSLFILTTPEGADLPASAREEGFPLLVRLGKDTFDFSQARPHGEDIRFTTAAGAPLPYQIDHWDAAAGTAGIWVRVPSITGNARQELCLHWGKADAASESDGKAVFNGSNGYLSVWHMDDVVQDDVGTLESQDTGTTATAGIIGKGRHFPGGKGITCGDKITTYPTGSASHTSQAWFRADHANANILGWGNEKGQGKVVMQFASPPHIRMECYFSNGNVESAGMLALAQWIHVAHAYQNGESRIYVNGVPDGVNASKNGPLAIKSPAHLFLGGWYNHYSFAGDMDEVRVSKVTRSADWIRMEYENQKPLQTLVGSLVQAGNQFSVSEKNLTLQEGRTATLSAQAGGAQKLYWILKRGGKESIAAVDCCTYIFPAGRVAADESLVLRFKAIYPSEMKTCDIPITIRKTIPDPVVTLQAPAAWNGRDTIEVLPQIANLAAMRSQGAGPLQYTWTVSGMAVIKEILSDRLVLKRAMNSGTLKVTLALSNGGERIIATAALTVKEPARDAWVQRTPGREEKPVDNQFYARDDGNEGSLFYNGTLDQAADAVFLHLYADGVRTRTESRKPGADNGYAFTIKLKPGLIVYKVEFGTRIGGVETVRNTVNNIICGDAYLIDGQSNAVAADFGKEEDGYTSEWIRSFGDGDPAKAWGRAVRRGGRLSIGYWGMDVARHLVETQKIPICIINGAVGGTLIEAHQRNPARSTDKETIYGRLLERITGARLTHGIRGAFWHQGENNQGTQGATGGYGWETYEPYFVDLTAAWLQDYPNIQHFHLFQIWPNSCGMGGTWHSDKLRDVQRLLPRLYAHASVMSTLGIKPEGPCHYPAAGYAAMARQIIPLVEQHHYGKTFDRPITAPDVQQAYFTSDRKDAIALEFDQPVVWTEGLAKHFHPEGKGGEVIAGAVSGTVLTLTLSAGTDAGAITYLADRRWDSKTLLVGQNGIAALTFWGVPIASRAPSPVSGAGRSAP